MNKGQLILSLETATRGGSLALMRGESVLASSTGIADESHSTNLLSGIESLLNQAHVTLHEVDLFATASGPGSFTGLRIGIATIKAFASTLNRPCIGVPTLEAIALAGGTSSHTIALLPAGRGEVFAQAFDMRSAVPRALSEPEHIPPQMLLERMKEPTSVHWAGSGAHVFADLIRARAEELGIPGSAPGSAGILPAVTKSTQSLPLPVQTNQPQWTLAPSEEQLAIYVAILAMHLSDETYGHSAEDLHAIYVRPSDAEMMK